MDGRVGEGRMEGRRKLGHIEDKVIGEHFPIIKHGSSPFHKAHRLAGGLKSPAGFMLGSIIHLGGAGKKELLESGTKAALECRIFFAKSCNESPDAISYKGKQ